MSALASDERPSPTLVALAEACGISTSYWSFFGDRVEVPAPTLHAVLDAMGIHVRDDAETAAALQAVHDEPWRDLLPASLVVRQGTGELVVHVADAHDVHLTIACEDGSWRDLTVPDQSPAARAIDDALVWELRVPLPGDLPLGWHTVYAWQRPFGSDVDDRSAECALVVTPSRLAPPPSRPDNHGRGWGLMAQLYSVRSRGSWGIGDFADLADLSAIAGRRGADFLLINPVHAAEVTTPIEPSPYLPSTRRFLAPLYVRPEDIRETAYLSDSDRALLEQFRAPAAALDTDAARIDRDIAWTAKVSALEVVFAVPRTAARQAELDAYVAREGQPLVDFALWCALEEHFAATLAPGEERPEQAWDIRSPLVARLREQLSDRVAFHVWLQWIADEQLARAQAGALASGMRIGVMHDLAVGVHPEGSDWWSMRDMYAPGMAVGAPPDMYNQRGQTWSQPPWLPQALAKAAYAPLRDMIRSLLRNAGALRIDHILGFFRLWWIPEGLSPAAGAYVRYDHEAMIGVLALEAHRAGAVLIGEDLGNVEGWVREYLAGRGILGTSVLWFENDDDGPLAPEKYRADVLATVNTHDLPPTAGYLAGEHVDLRARLGLLAQPEAEVRAEAEAERDRMLAVLRERGLLGAAAPSTGSGTGAEQEIIEALHVHIVSSPSRLVAVSLVDAVGERRVQNQPGTDKEYPNWQVPLADSAGNAVLIEDLPRNARFVSLTDAVDQALRR